MIKDPASPFAVIIPMYNGARYIDRALECVSAQVVSCREVVVVDDGSRDDGWRAATRWPGVDVLRQENRGAGAARNAGAAVTSAPWIAFLDVDDLWLPTHLAALRRVIEQVPEAGLVSTGHRTWHDSDAARRLRDCRAPRPRSGRLIDYFQAAGRDIEVVWTSAAAVRRTAFDEVGGFAHLSGPEDIELWARLALRHPVGRSRARTAIYVRGTGGLMERSVAGGRADSAPWVPLQELTPSIRSVVELLATHRSDVAPRSIELYIDGRVTSGWRGVVLRADQERARRRLRELHHPRHRSAWPFVVAARLPRPVARGLAGLLGSLTRLRARRR